MAFLRTALLLLTGVVSFFPVISAQATTEQITLFFGERLEQRLESFLEEFAWDFSSQCYDVFENLEAALQQPRAACEIFITSTQPLVIPDEIGKLYLLEDLGIDGPPVLEISPALWTLSKLTNLQLRQASLRSISSEIGNLKNLDVLDLSENKLEALPSSITNLNNLSVLFLGGNTIDQAAREQIQDWLPHTEIIFE